MVDTRDSKSRDSNIMRVQVPPSAQDTNDNLSHERLFFVVCVIICVVMHR